MLYICFTHTYIHTYIKATITKYQKLGGLKHSELTVWRLEVQNQGVVSRALILLTALGEKPSLPLLASHVC